MKKLNFRKKNVTICCKETDLEAVIQLLVDTEDIFLDVCDIKPVITAVFVFVFWLVNVTGVSKS